MAYTVEFRTAAAQQTIPLSEDEYVTLIDALRAAARDPFDANHSMATPDVHVRRIEFGRHSVGLASVFIDVQAETLRVFDVRWVG